jgi:ABC-type polysaccharide/polyol phosphate transport system ATPase subunit
MTTMVHFDSVAKRYQGSFARYKSLRDELARVVARLRGRTVADSMTVDALDDVSFEIDEGESVAIIGPNGAGKTTALRIMSRITYPTEGVVRVRGRVGALLEGGTGMHPELTGRENIGLYGRILGLSGRQVQQRFEQIVSFAGVAEAIERPVKQYSSGMQLRLGFSVAAHLEPDVLLVDEAIAVGDAGFQARCVERMRELVSEGRTLIFVSHDMSAVETLCDRAILLDRGRIRAEGPAGDVIESYLSAVEAARLDEEGEVALAAGDRLAITAVTIHDASGRQVVEVGSDERMTVRLHYRAAEPIEGPIFSVGLGDARIGVFSLASMLVDGETPERLHGNGTVDCEFESLPLYPRTYEVWVSVRAPAGYGDLVDWQRMALVRVVGEVAGKGRGAVFHSLADAPVKIPYRWRFGRGSLD